MKDSEWLNVSVASSELIKLTLESVPNMITMHLESATGAASAQITIGGMAPQTTYHKYEDNYHNHEAFTTDDNGSYTYIQDLSVPHMVFIQTHKSTKFIKDDATGGDCWSIGIWDSATKTCTMTMDLNETVQIDSDGVTLDGNGHTLTGGGTGSGIYLSGRSGVSIKNFNISQFVYGIYLDYYSTSNIIKNNIISNNIIYIAGSNNTISGNIIEWNPGGHYINDGIYISGPNNIISSNTLSSNIRYNMCCYFNAGIEIYGYRASGNIISDNNVSNDNGDGIVVLFGGNNVLTNNTCNSNRIGIYLYLANGAILSGNKMSGNLYLNIAIIPTKQVSSYNIDTTNLVEGI